jgi:hypothetical protein
MNIWQADQEQEEVIKIILYNKKKILNIHKVIFTSKIHLRGVLESN